MAVSWDLRNEGSVLSSMNLRLLQFSSANKFSATVPAVHGTNGLMPVRTSVMMFFRTVLTLGCCMLSNQCLHSGIIICAHAEGRRSQSAEISYLVCMCRFAVEIGTIISYLWTVDVICTCWAAA